MMNRNNIRSKLGIPVLIASLLATPLALLGATSPAMAPNGPTVIATAEGGGWFTEGADSSKNTFGMDVMISDAVDLFGYFFCSGDVEYHDRNNGYRFHGTAQNCFPYFTTGAATAHIIGTGILKGVGVTCDFDVMAADFGEPGVRAGDQFVIDIDCPSTLNDDTSGDTIDGGNIDITDLVPAD